MANFPTHIAVGTVVSGALATVTVAADMVAPENIVAVTLAGVLGSVLPDIDLEESRPARAMFSGLAVFFSFAVLFGLERKYSIAEMFVLWLGTFFLVRYVAKEVFFRFSYHRGVWHSLLALVFCAVVTAWERTWHEPELQLWHEEERFEVKLDGRVIQTQTLRRSPSGRWYSQEQAIKLLKDTGFSEVQMFSGFSRSPATADDRLICAVAIKG